MPLDSDDLHGDKDNDYVGGCESCKYFGSGEVSEYKKNPTEAGCNELVEL